MPPATKCSCLLPLPRILLRPRHNVTSNLPQKRHLGIKSLQKNPDTTQKYKTGPGLVPLQSSQRDALERKMLADTLPLRTGALAIKKGMTALFDPESGKRIPCTVLQLDQNQVIQHKTRKIHGYYAVCVGSGWKHSKNVTKPMLGHFSAAGVAPKRHLHEFRVRDRKGLLPVGEDVQADWFVVGQYVDARSNTKGKGFAGVMKRHGFKGQPRTHGHSLSHRSMGSAGPSQGGGSRVYPGKKMAGNMGGERHTIQNMKVLLTDKEKGIVVVNGCLSGPKGGIVAIQDAIKKPWPEVPGIPIKVKDELEQLTPVEPIEGEKVKELETA